MSDSMRFTPDRFEVVRGETVRLRMANRAMLLHELVIGTKAELDAHAELMRRFTGMKHHELDFACQIAGHYQAGMAGRIKVTERP